MEIVVASNNQHKIKEYQEIFNQFNIKILSLKDVGITIHPNEDGDTFMENSLIKAKECAKYTNKIILADDSGLIINSLPDILGVQSSRFLGEDTPYETKRLEILNRIKGKKRDAKFVCCITILNLEEQPLVFVGEVKGVIAKTIEGNEGFGYDPIFIPNGFQKTFASLGEEIKNKISHRSVASLKMIKYFKEKYNENTID